MDVIENNPSELLKESYLESIGSVDKANVQSFTQIFDTYLEQSGKVGFVAAVGGTANKINPEKRDDIDILVGVKNEFGDMSNLAPIGKYRKRYEFWKETLDKVLKPLKDEGLETVDEGIYPDHERENLAATDGKITLNFPTGRPIELLCYQDTPLKNQIILFSNLDSSMAA